MYISKVTFPTLFVNYIQQIPIKHLHLVCKCVFMHVWSGFTALALFESVCGDSKHSIVLCFNRFKAVKSFKVAVLSFFQIVRNSVARKKMQLCLSYCCIYRTNQQESQPLLQNTQALCNILFDIKVYLILKSQIWFKKGHDLAWGLLHLHHFEALKS